MSKQSYPWGFLVAMVPLHLGYIFLYFILYLLGNSRFYGFFYINIGIYLIYIAYLIYLSIAFSSSKVSRAKMVNTIVAGFFIMVVVNFFSCVVASKFGLDR